ncbi:MAG TPA: hypothetical protein VF170_10540 [Planctomycetaceae bacterium]
MPPFADAITHLLAAGPGLIPAAGNGPSREVIVTIVAVIAVAAFWAGIYFWDLRRRSAPAPKGPGLFGDLARVHRLSDADRELLRRATVGLSNPAVAFVDPEVLDRYAFAHPADATGCDALRERLFGA